MSNTRTIEVKVTPTQMFSFARLIGVSEGTKMFQKGLRVCNQDLIVDENDLELLMNEFCGYVDKSMVEAMIDELKTMQDVDGNDIEDIDGYNEIGLKVNADTSIATFELLVSDDITIDGQDDAEINDMEVK